MIGLKSATDGEYRRISWNYDFLERLDNVESYVGERKIKFASSGPQPRPILLRVIGKLGGYKPHPMIEHFKFLKAHTKETPKLTIPSPSSLHFRYGRDVVPEKLYPSMNDFYRDLGETYRKAVHAFADAGCRYLQLDEVNLAYLCDPTLAQADHRSRRGSGGAARHLCRHDQCGDLRHPARHDHHHASVPREFSLELRRQRAATSRWPNCCSIRSTCTATSWNTTPSAPAVSSRCASCPRARPWCSASSPANPGGWKAATRSSAASSRRRNSSTSISSACRRNAASPPPKKATCSPRKRNGRSCG